jgi:hypothetical protein
MVTPESTLELINMDYGLEEPDYTDEFACTGIRNLPKVDYSRARSYFRPMLPEG